MSTRPLSVFAALLLTSVTGVFGQTPPANDNFANRTVLTGSSITFSGTPAGGTYESPETNFLYFSSPPGGGSVWWTWTAPSSTRVVIVLLWDGSPVSSGSDFEVFTGTNVNALTPLSGNGFVAPGVRYVSFAATAGASYQFRMAGGWSQALNVRLTATNPPIFLIQPKDCVVSPYGSALFTAATSDVGLSGPYTPPSTSYQWTFNGVPLPGENYPGLVIHGVNTNHAGSYSLIASNAGGVSESIAAVLTVTDTNPVPRLVAMPATNQANISFSLTGEGGRWYKIESSQDLVNWGNPFWVRPTNATSLISVPRLGSTHFVRAALSVSSDVCAAQLKRMRAVSDIAAVENKASPYAGEQFQDILPLLPVDSSGFVPRCPEEGFYLLTTFVNDPICSVGGHGHNINEH